MAFLIDYVNDVSQRAGLVLTQRNENNETIKDFIVRIFNFYHKDFNSRHPWPWRTKTTIVNTIPNYETGTVTVTRDSRTVTGSGTVWTTAMAGRFLKLNRDNDFYEILSVESSTSLTLRSVYNGANGSGLSYLIWARYLDLDPDVPYMSEIVLSLYPYVTQEIPRKEFNSSYITAYQQGNYPSEWYWAHVNRTVSTYNTGTVSGSVGSTTLTGSGTSWLGNVFQGSEVIIENERYNIETIDSNTTITLVQNINVSIPAGSAYRIETRGRGRIALSSVPDPAVALYVTYPKKTYNFKHDEDRVEIWEGQEHILTNVIYGHVLEKLTSEKAFSWINIYEQQIRQAWGSMHRSTLDKVPMVRNARSSGYRRALYG